MVHQVLLQCAVFYGVVKIILKHNLKTPPGTLRSIVITYKVQFRTIGMKYVIFLEQED